MFISKKWLWTNNYEWPKSQEKAHIYEHNVLPTKKKTYGILFSTKKEFFQKYASVCFYSYQGSPLACVGLEKVYEIFSWKSNDWLIAWLAAVLAY